MEAVQHLSLKAYAAEGYPDLKRGMVITVYRPASTAWRGPIAAFWAFISWRIRVHSTRLLGEEATESHAMIYVGAGRCWSQDQRFRVVHLHGYRHCRLTFLDAPNWTQDERNAFVAECGPHQGEEYGYRDIWSMLQASYEKDPASLPQRNDKAHWICSEAVCALLRKAVKRLARALGFSCLITPQELRNRLVGAGWRQLKMMFA